MSQDFYSSGYDMGQWQQQQQQAAAAQQQAWSEQQGWSDQSWSSPQSGQYTPNTSQQYASPTASTGYGGQYAAQQPAYTSPSQPPGQFYSSEGYSAGQQQQGFYSGSYYNPADSMGTMGGAGPGPQPTATGDSFEDEPPLMEELGIDLPQIYQTTMTVLNPTKQAVTNLMDEPDLSGPLIFCLLFGSLLLLSGKIHFGYIYGVALVGTVAMYTLLNLMSVNGVSASVTVSVLGYCMLPMCVLAGISAVLSLKGIFGVLLCSFTVSWAAFASSKLFVRVLAMYDQQPLVGYPCAIMYGVFAVLTVF